MSDLLVHACCGPCAEFPVEQLLTEGYRPLLWFFNPNIHPRAEWRRRLQQLLLLAEKWQLPCLVEPDFDQAAWQHYDPALSGGRSRCRMCYETRLDAAAVKARALGFAAFTTTLLVSPYQDHEALCSIGSAAASRNGLAFLDRDFRPGFRAGQQQARADGLYRQKYCGCINSLQESSFREKILPDLAMLARPGDPAVGP